MILKALAIAAALALTTPAQAMSKAEYCVTWGNLAHDIVVARDNKVPLADLLLSSDSNPDIEALILVIFEAPYLTPREASEIVIIGCMKAN